jgi:hypothetical protein
LAEDFFNAGVRSNYTIENFEGNERKKTATKESSFSNVTASIAEFILTMKKQGRKERRCCVLDEIRSIRVFKRWRFQQAKLFF